MRSKWASIMSCIVLDTYVWIISLGFCYHEKVLSGNLSCFVAKSPENGDYTMIHFDRRAKISKHHRTFTLEARCNHNYTQTVASKYKLQYHSRSNLWRQAQNWLIRYSYTFEPRLIIEWWKIAINGCRSSMNDVQATMYFS